MVEGIEPWPCMPRVSGLIPGAGKLKKMFNWMKILWSHTEIYHFVQGSQSGHRATMSAAVRLVRVRSRPMLKTYFRKAQKTQTVTELLINRVCQLTLVLVITTY